MSWLEWQVALSVAEAGGLFEAWREDKTEAA